MNKIANNDNKLRLALISLETEKGLIEAVIFADRVEYYSDTDVPGESKPRRHSVVSLELMHAWAMLYAMAAERGYVPTHPL